MHQPTPDTQLVSYFLCCLCVKTSAEYFKGEHALKSHVLLYSVMLCDNS